MEHMGSRYAYWIGVGLSPPFKNKKKKENKVNLQDYLFMNYNHQFINNHLLYAY